MKQIPSCFLLFSRYLGQGVSGLDTQIESSKRASVAVLGNHSIAQLPNLPLIADYKADAIKETDYFLLSIKNSRDAVENILQTLETQKILRSQIVFVLENDANNSFANTKHFTTFALGNLESPEEARTRLMQFLDQQKHKIVWEFWESQTNLTFTETLVEKIHFTHSMALALNLTTQEHWKALQFASQIQIANSEIWNSSYSLPEVVAQMADLAHRNLHNPTQLREELRAKSMHVPFRMRTEFRSALEKCFELIWKGSNAA
jgi:hypothetical protein